MQPLRMTSCMAPNMDDACRALAAYIGDRLKMEIEFVNQISWQERYRQLDTGDIQLAWICGAPYVRRMAGAEPNIELLDAAKTSLGAVRNSTAGGDEAGSSASEAHNSAAIF